MVKLSKRLKQVASFVPLGTVVADIGTDHALLPSFLVQEKISPSAIAVDINEGPIKVAQAQIRKLLLADKISVRYGDGLEPIKVGEVQTVVIAGMGGSTITKILNKSTQVVAKLQRLILQPNLAADLVRSWAVHNNWKIIDEEIIFEDGHFYEIIVLEPGKMELEDDIYLFLGPKLVEKYHVYLVDYLKNQKKAEQEILKQLEKSNSKEAQEKSKSIREKWNKIGQVIKCHLDVEI
ncbi:MAG: tRNA (adenine22-N1)-methyltransferase [Clostridia bacterium]|jgi:tRNA (adenine22-N1)-methyltransferase|nr:tRNA (adenine22-N1)-methyltransferase [Clostridia bacterium]